VAAILSAFLWQRFQVRFCGSDFQDTQLGFGFFRFFLYISLTFVFVNTPSGQGGQISPTYWVVVLIVQVFVTELAQIWGCFLRVKSYISILTEIV
jgi:hypothetical protein